MENGRVVGVPVVAVAEGLPLKWHEEVASKGRVCVVFEVRIGQVGYLW
jgi:hypothetical protein